MPEPSSLPVRPSSHPDASHDGVENWFDGNVASQVPPDSKRRLVVVAVVLAIVCVGLSLLSVTRATRLSALDEGTHIDYAWSVAHFRLPVTGMPLSDFTLTNWACRGQANVKKLPPCGGHGPYRSFPGAGQQYNGFHPPVYYAITGLVSRPLAAATGQNFITVARSLGALWLFAASFFLYATLRYWRVHSSYALLAALSLPLLPMVLHASSTVNNDAPAALSGVAAVFVLGRVLVHRRTGWIIPVVLTLLAASTKILNAMGLLVVAGLLVALALMRWRRGGFTDAAPYLRIGILMIVAVGFVYVVWGQVSSYHTVPNWVNPNAGRNTDLVVGSPIDNWLHSMVSGFRLGASPYLDPKVTSTLLFGWVVASSLVLNSSSFVGLALFRRPSAAWVLSLAVLVGCLTYPLVVQVQAYLNSHYYFPVVTARYGLSLIPMALSVWAMIAATRRLWITNSTIVGAGFVIVLATTAGLLQ